jgi:hypothetical protein
MYVFGLHVQRSFFVRKHSKNGYFVKFWCVQPNLEWKNAWYHHTTIGKMKLDSKKSIGHIFIFVSPCERVFFCKKTPKECVICEILMYEAKSWQAKLVILPQQYIQNKTDHNHWLAILMFFIPICKGLFSWENIIGKICNFWNFDAWSQVLTGKTCNTTTKLYENQTLDFRNQLAISMFLFHHVQDSFFSRKHRQLNG